MKTLVGLVGLFGKCNRWRNRASFHLLSDRQSGTSRLPWLSPLLLIGIALSAAQLRAADPVSLAALGEWPGHTNAYAVSSQVIGNLAYVTLGYEGLLVADISDPADPQRLGACRLKSYAQHACVNGALAFIATKTGLEIVDISDPAYPKVVGNYATADECIGVDVYEGIAYLSGYDGVTILDVRQPSLVKHLSTYRTSGEAKSVRLFGPIAYVRTRVAIEVVEVSNLSGPRFIRVLDFDSSTPTGLAIEEQNLVASFVGKMAGLYIFGLQNPTNPALLGKTYTGSVIPFGGPTGNHPTALSVAEGTAYVTTHNRKLMAFSITNLAQPSFLADYTSLPGGESLNDITVSGDRVYVSAGPLGVQIFSSIQSGFTRQGALESSWDFRGVAITNKIALVVDYINGFHVIDVSVPGRPARLGSLQRQFDGSRITLLDGMALVADGTNGLSYIGIAEPANPALLGSVTFGVPVRDIQVVNTRAYVACDVGGLVILSIIDPVNPSLLGQYRTPSAALQVAVLDGFAYVADGSGGLQILDITDPKLPGRVKELRTGFVNTVTVANRIAYVGLNGRSVYAYDISNPAAPQLLQTMTGFPSGTVCGIAATGGQILVAYDQGAAIFAPGSTAPTSIFAAFNSKAVSPSASAIYLVGDFGLKVLSDNTRTPLAIAMQSPDHVRLSWKGSGVLQSATSPAGPWNEIQDATSPFTLLMNQQQLYFRIK